MLKYGDHALRRMVSNKSYFLLKLVDFGPNGAYDGANSDDNETSTQLQLTNSSAWNTVSIPLSAMSGLSNTSAIAQLVIESNNGSGTVFLDNIYFESAAAPLTEPNSSATCT